MASSRGIIMKRKDQKRSKDVLICSTSVVKVVILTTIKVILGIVIVVSTVVRFGEVRVLLQLITSISIFSTFVHIRSNIIFGFKSLLLPFLLCRVVSLLRTLFPTRCNDITIFVFLVFLVKVFALPFPANFWTIAFLRRESLPFRACLFRIKR